MRARTTITLAAAAAAGMMIESDIPQLTRPPNAVSAALWLRGQAEYALTNPGCVVTRSSHQPSVGIDRMTPLRVLFGLSCEFCTLTWGRWCLV